MRETPWLTAMKLVGRVSLASRRSFPDSVDERDSRYRYQPAPLASDCVCQMANIASWWQRGNDRLRTTVVDDQPSNIAQFYCRNRRAAQAETASVCL
jgi:hypothetical protein